MRTPAPKANSSIALRRAGLTLVEMMVSLVCVLLLMMAYTQLFSDVGSKVGEARSMIELNSRIRSAAQRLRADLEAHTCDMRVWQRPESGAGYFEYIEGPLNDKNNGLPGSYAGMYNAGTYSIADYPLGDTDDVLMFTVRSKEGPFTGRYTDPNGNKLFVQSDVAEVAWFLRPTLKADNQNIADPPTFTLYRRVFLVMPTYNGVPVTINPGSQITDGIDDISAHDDGSGTNFIANTLGDLTKRECRFGHYYQSTSAASNPNSVTAGFPHRLDPAKLVPFGAKFNASNLYVIDPTLPSYARYGEDVVLTNVLSFDVQVWDPTAPVYILGTAPNQYAVAPGDAGFLNIHPAGNTLASLNPSSPSPTNPAPSRVGAYVDLNWLNAAWDGTSVAVPWAVASVGGPSTMSPFYSQGHPHSNLTAATAPTYDFLKSWLLDNNKNTLSMPIYSPGNVPATFDTWSFHYESDGLNQDSFDRTKYRPAGNDSPNPTSDVKDTVVDQGTDQIGRIQDTAHPGFETSPPYPVPLRGLRVRIRCYEPDARDVREVTVTESFVPD